MTNAPLENFIAFKINSKLQLQKFLSFITAAAILLSLISFPSFSAGGAQIKDVAVSGGVIVPGFLPTVTDYTVAIDEEGDIPDVLYTLFDNTAGVEIVKAEDNNETTTIKVTNGQDEKTYSFTFVGKNDHGTDGLVTLAGEEDLTVLNHYAANGSDQNTPNIPC